MEGWLLAYGGTQLFPACAGVSVSTHWRKLNRICNNFFLPVTESFVNSVLVLENNLQAFISPKFGLEVVEDKRNFMEIWFVICCFWRPYQAHYLALRIQNELIQLFKSTDLM